MVAIIIAVWILGGAAGYVLRGLVESSAQADAYAEQYAACRDCPTRHELAATSTALAATTDCAGLLLSERGEHAHA